MRLSEWRAAAPNRDAAAAKVSAIVDPVLTALGAEPDPHGWVVWGEEPGSRYSILLPIDSGLVVCFVRVLVPGEGPRASAKLVRWSRVSIGELSVEAERGHRLLSFQVEQQVLRGVDAEADRVAAFALRVIAAIDGRPLPPIADATGRARSGKAPAKTAATRTSAAKPASTAAKPTARTSAGPARASAGSDRDRAAARSRR